MIASIKTSCNLILDVIAVSNTTMSNNKCCPQVYAMDLGLFFAIHTFSISFSQKAINMAYNNRKEDNNIRGEWVRDSFS